MKNLKAGSSIQRTSKALVWMEVMDWSWMSNVDDYRVEGDAAIASSVRRRPKSTDCHTQLLQKCGVKHLPISPFPGSCSTGNFLFVHCQSGSAWLISFFPWCICLNCILALMLQMSAKPFLDLFILAILNLSQRTHVGIVMVAPLR